MTRKQSNSFLESLCGMLDTAPHVEIHDQSEVPSMGAFEAARTCFDFFPQLAIFVCPP